MKKMKKIIALLIAMVMVLGVSTTVFADETYDTATVTIAGIADSDMVYLYKIADAEVGGDNVVNYQNFNNFGTSYTIDQIAAIDSDNYADMSATGSDAKDLADALAAAAVASGEDAAYVKTGTEAEDGFEVDAGYYVAFVKGSNAEVLYQNMLINAVMVANSETNSYDAATVSFEVKKSEIIIKKTAPNTEEALENARTSDGYKRFDYIPFTITTTVPNYPQNATYATMEIHDTPTGITLQNSETYPVTVKVNGTEVAPSDSTYSLDVTDSGLDIVFVKEYILAHVQESVEVTYTGQLTAEPELVDGAMNEAVLRYNPNPYDEETFDKDPIITFYTYGYVFEKVKESDGSALEGATFTLYADNEGVKGDPILDDEGNPVTSTSTKVGDNAYVYFDGLAAGTYWVSETTVPSGFNAVADFSFAVSKENATEDNPATTNITEKNFLVEEEPVSDPEGVQLPSTGGIGTTIFYTIGAILVIGAGVILVTRRRMNVQ